MPPKVTDNRAASAESLHAVEEETAIAAQRIVATYAKDFLDYTTLTCMLGVEPKGLIYRRVEAELGEPKKAKKTTKRSTKKSTKKTSKKSTKKTTKKTTKKSTKKTAKKTAKKTSKKSTKATKSAE